MELNSGIRSFAIITSLAFTSTLILSPANALPTPDAPAVITAICPIFPAIARAAHVSGEVAVEARIGVEGKVLSAKASSGHPLLRKAAEEAAMRWQFGTSTDPGSSRNAQLIFVFRIMPRCSKADELTSIFSPPYRVEVRVEKPEVICNDCPPSEVEKLRCKNP
jgi:TonB family protein